MKLSDKVITIDESVDYPSPKKVDEPDMKYGILIYVNKDNKFEMNFKNQDQASFNDMVALVDIAQRKLSAIFDSREHPLLAALMKGMDNLKHVQVQSSTGILEALNGITLLLQEVLLGTKGAGIDEAIIIDEVREENDPEAEDKVQTE